MSDWADVEASMDELREEANVIAMRTWFVSAAEAWRRIQSGRTFPSATGSRRLAVICEALGGSF